MGHIGKSSISFDNNVYILQYSSIVGKKEGEGPLCQYFDEVYSDPLFNTNNWEEAESMMIHNNIQKLLDKAALETSDIDFILSGDLLGQLIGTSFGVINFNIPLFGLYGACSTFGEALSLGSILISSGYANKVISSASSHFASAEKTFFYLDCYRLW